MVFVRYFFVFKGLKVNSGKARARIEKGIYWNNSILKCAGITPKQYQASHLHKSIL